MPDFEFLYVDNCLVSSQTPVQLSIRSAELIVAGRGFQKTNVSRWDVVLTVQLTAHASVSIKPVRFCFPRSLGRVHSRTSPQRPPWGQREKAIVAALGRQWCYMTPVSFGGCNSFTFKNA